MGESLFDRIRMNWYLMRRTIAPHVKILWKWQQEVSPSFQLIKSTPLPIQQPPGLSAVLLAQSLCKEHQVMGEQVCYSMVALRMFVCLHCGGPGRNFMKHCMLCSPYMHLLKENIFLLHAPCAQKTCVFCLLSEEQSYSSAYSESSSD